jgi:hypothetical protein
LNPEFLRQLVETIENLNESKGLAGRRPGDTFVDLATSDTLVFNDLEFFPEEGGVMTPEELAKKVKDLQTQRNMKINWENVASPRTGGFALASFKKGKDTVYTGTYLQNVKPNALDNYIPNVVMKKYNFAGKAAAKTQAGLTPQDLLTERSNLTAKDIMVQLAAKLGTSSPLYHVAHHVAMGQPLPLEINAPADISFTAFRDYFCEILQPIALQKGLYDGNAGEAADIFLAPEGFAGAKINFDASKNAGLADSVLELSDGRYIKISSKGDKGAEASVKNLIDSVNSLGENPQAKKLANKYKEVIELVKEVQQAGQSGAPLYLGVKYNLITAQEAQIIRGLKGNAPVDMSDEERLKQMGLTDNLIKLAKDRKTKNPKNVSLYYHLLASVAHKSAEIVNEKTNFSDAASAILNNGALVQVYTKATERAGKWVLNRFMTIYPSASVSGVLFSAQKNYSSTEIKGNFTFKILRDKAKAAEEENVETTAAPAEPEPEITDFDVDAKRTTRDRKTGAGRERRR